MPADVLAILTERKAEVLGLVMQRLQTSEITHQLFVALSTVNSHLKRIYQKLDVRKGAKPLPKFRPATVDATWPTWSSRRRACTPPPSLNSPNIPNYWGGRHRPDSLMFFELPRTDSSFVSD